MNKKPPVWGKTIGILMIIIGSLGIFLQLFKVIFPGYMKVFPAMLDRSFDRVQDSDPIQAQSISILRKQWEVTDGEVNMVMAMGIIGIILLILYIIGGAKLLKPNPSNYHFAKYNLMIFVAFNGISAIYLIYFNENIFFRSLGIYVMVGFAIDLVLLIIALQSNKFAYGIGVDQEMVGYTLNGESEEII